jgi:hypothetical protein
MLGQLLPQRIDNTYRGSKLAPWLFALILSLKTAPSLLSIFNGYSVAMSADGIPLDAYPPASAQTVVALFALSGFYHLLIFLLCILALVRYRSALPFMFALLALDYLGRTLILQFLPIVRTGTPIGPIVNLVLFALMIAGLALSLRSAGNRSTSLAFGRVPPN